MNSKTVRRPALPGHHRALTQIESAHDGLRRAAIGDQGHHAGDQFIRRMQAVEGVPALAENVRWQTVQLQRVVFLRCYQSERVIAKVNLSGFKLEM